MLYYEYSNSISRSVEAFEEHEVGKAMKGRVSFYGQVIGSNPIYIHLKIINCLLELNTSRVRVISKVLSLDDRGDGNSLRYNTKL